MTMQAALGLYAEFDMYSGCKLGSAEAAGNALNMVYSSDGSQLCVLTAVGTWALCNDCEWCFSASACESTLSCCQVLVQDRGLFTLSLPSLKRKVLLPPHKRYNMQKAHLVLLGVRLASSARQALRTAAMAA